MKILVLDTQWNQGFNGGYTSMMELCRAWPEGHELKILGKYFKPEGVGEDGEALVYFEDLAATQEWITTVPVGFDAQNPEGWIPDIIWINALQELRLGDELSQTLTPGRKIPLVANIRSLQTKLSPDELNRLIRLDQLICASAFGAQDWENNYGFDVAIIPNSVNLRRFKPDEVIRSAIRSKLKLTEPNDRLLLYLGRIEETKGVNDLPYILREAQAARPDLNYHMAVIGRKGKMPTNFKLQLKNMGMKNIHIFDFTPAPETWMQAADCMLVPSRWEELFGKVIIEAMACGCPVLASDRGGIPEILSGDLARFVMDSPCKPRQWGNAIAALEEKNLGGELIAAASNYDAKKLARQYVELFECVIKGKD
jgi:glycosyltransferase involved in cell wall biosynthesis